MTPLMTIDELRSQINSSLSDADLLRIQLREESEMIRWTGAHADGVTTISATVFGGYTSIYLPRAFASIASVSESIALGGSASALSSSAYYGIGAEGRIVRLPSGARWGASVAVEYLPADDTLQRKSVLVELVRLALERQVMKSESIAGEHSYTAPEWEQERRMLLKRLTFQEL